MAHPERRPAAPEHGGERPADERLLDVEALEDVQHAERGEQGHREVERAAPPPRQRPADADQPQAGREGQRVREADVAGGRE
ncbi:MAG: hypothetical protein HZB46_05525 [Solirubrobacterales bacterium]|nr:hypothetical protein [Solirubrobacterales bacterium]